MVVILKRYIHYKKTQQKKTWLVTLFYAIAIQAFKQQEKCKGSIKVVHMTDALSFKSS